MRIVVIGSVAAGTSAAAKIKRNKEETEVIVYEKDKDISYSVCGIPYWIGLPQIEKKQLAPRTPEWFYKRFRISIFTGHEVLEIKPERKELLIKKLETGEIITDHYDKLVLACGSLPIRPTIPGIDQPNVFTVKNLQDAENILHFIQKNQPQKALIIGGGFIGLEMLENLTKREIKTSLVEKSSQLMPQLDNDVSVYIHKYLKNKKIDFYLNEEIIEIKEKEAFCRSGKKIEADFFIFAVGVRPNTALAQKAGILLGRTGAIAINSKMQTNKKDIYAVGDCAESFSLITGKPVYRPLGSTANKMGRIAGDQISDGDLEFRGILGTGICQCFDLTIAHTGLTEKEAIQEGYEVEVIHNIKPNQSEYFSTSREIMIKAIAHKKNGRLLGAQIVGEKGVDKRIDVFATAITFGAKVGDLFHLDLAYAPPFATTKDPVLYTGMILENALKRGRKIITPQKLMEKREEYLVIDVRSKEDFNKAHIEGAFSIPLEELKEKVSHWDRKKKIVVHCNKGNTGNAAQNLLLNMGFKEVYNLSGGFTNYQTWMINK